MNSTGYRSSAAAEQARAWIKSAAARSDPPLETCTVTTRFGSTHLLRARRSGGRERVCLPGWGTCSAFWAVAGQLAPLAESASVSILDIPGQPGLSAGSALPGDAQAVGAWLSDVLDALRVADVDVLGSSLGGLLAVRANRALEGRIRKLVLLAPAGFVLPLARPKALRAVLRHRLRGTRESATAFIDACLLGGVQELDSGVRAELAEALCRSPNAHAMRLPSLRLSDAELRDTASELLLVLGARDPVFSPTATLRRAQRLLPSPFDHVVLPGHGHALELSRDALSAAAAFLDAGSR